MIDSHHHILAYAMNGKFLGIIGGMKLPGLYGPVVYSSHLYISPAERDGYVLKRLTEALTEWAREQGVKFLYGAIRYSPKSAEVIKQFGFEALGMSICKEL